MKAIRLPSITPCTHKRELGLAGHPIDGQFETLPVQLLAIFEQPIEPHAVDPFAVGLNRRGVVKPFGVLAHVGHAVECPKLSAPFFAQVRSLQEMIAVHVRWDHGIDPLQAEMLAHTDDRLIEHFRFDESAINGQPATAVGDDQIEIRVVVGPTKLVDVRRDLPDMRHLRRSRQPILCRSGEGRNRITTN